MEAVENVEPTVEPIRFPQMRAEAVNALKSLADPEYQQRVWIRREYPHEQFFEDLTLNINILFDDVCVLPDPQERLGYVLYPNEVDALRPLAAVLPPLIKKLGEASDADYLVHPQWNEVVRAADAAYRVLAANDAKQ